MRLYLLRGCPFAHRATIALREKNVPFEPVFFAVGKRPPELEAAGPYAKSPTVIDGETVVWDGQIVLEYFEDRYPSPPLLPADPAKRARVRATIVRVERELAGKQGALVMETLFKPPDQRDAGKIADAKRALLDALPPWNDALPDREWLVDELSLADITLYTLFPAAQALGADVPPELTHLRAWIARMSARPSTSPVTEGPVPIPA